MARQFLQSQLATAEGEDYRRMLRRKLARLGGHRSVKEVETVRETFLQEQQDQIPYVPDAVYALLRDDKIRYGVAAAKLKP